MAVPAHDTRTRVASRIRRARRGLIVAGWGPPLEPAVVDRVAALTGWPVLADPVSGLRRGPATVSTYDALVRVEDFAAAHRPELVLRLGAPTTGRGLNAFLRGVPTILVDPDDVWLDPGRDTVARVVADGDLFLRALAVSLEVGDPPLTDVTWGDAWLTAERHARDALDAHLDASDAPFEGRIARDVVDAVPEGGALVVASSMPVRDLESFARPRDGIRVIANRGVNGIDGFVSTVVGVALASAGPVVALLGDLCLLHDQNGLLGARDRGIDATFVVVDNDGGGIFSFLPQATAAPEHFEALWGTPPAVDIGAVAALHGIPVDEITCASEVLPAVTEAGQRGGVRLVRVRTDRATNVEQHGACWSAVATALASY
jgi:2-succinyl-5-enolpyruvyl-6-hydroxy-3-cyclohexene-1-carboxylate synthase